jgi:hypothetical protein
MTKINPVKNDIETEFEGEQSLNDYAIEDHYPDILIKMTKEQFSIYELKRRKEVSGTLKIDPDFQRENNWSEKQRSELIESILMGIPIPIIYLFEDEKGLKQVVDGRQRLSCIFDYLNNTFKLNNLNILKNENNKKFNQLSPLLQGKIEDYQFLAYTIQHPTHEKVKFDIFDRVNRGGTRLNNQEMRNALYSGLATKLLKELVISESFLNATQNSVSTKRMKDRYIVLRFLGFFLYYEKKIDIEYKSDMDEFLADVMKFINGLDDKKISFLKEKFELSMKNCFLVLGNDAFRFASEGKKRPINMGLFECLGYMLSVKLPANANIKTLKNKIEKLKKEMDESAMFTGVIDSNIGVNYRFEKAKEIRDSLKCLTN